jgi:hypothetical protein
MPTAHLIFIPGVLIFGVFLGFILGVRAARNTADLERRREEQRVAARAARAARDAATSE